MQSEEIDSRVRPTLRCISMDDETWSKAKQVACENDRPVSSYIRSLIKSDYSRRKRG